MTWTLGRHASSRRTVVPHLALILAALGVVALPSVAAAQDAPGIFAGSVLDPDGRPVAGATVWLTTEDWQDWGDGPQVLAVTETDADGRFEFIDVPPAPGEHAHYCVSAHADGWALVWSGTIREVDADLLLVLEPPVSFTGRVIAPDGATVVGIKPHVGLLVRRPGFDPDEFLPRGSVVLYAPDEISALITTAADEAGEFEVRNLPPGVEISVSISEDTHPRVSARYGWRDLSGGVPIELELEPPGTIRGTVTRQDNGAPVPGVAVTRYGWRRQRKAVTDDAGRYAITNLASGVHHVHLHELPLDFTAEAVADITLEPGATVEGVDLHVVPGVVITGTVTDRDTGEPVADVGICCNTTQQPMMGSAWPVLHTDENGRYRLRASEGLAQMRPFDMPQGWVAAGDYFNQMKRISVDEAEAPIEVNFEVIRTRAISGVVLGPNEQPVPHARVVVVECPHVFFGESYVVANEAGLFHVTGLKSDTEVFLHAHSREAMSLEYCALEPGDNTDVTLRLVADARPTLTGRIIGEDGQPVSHAQVRADTKGTAYFVDGDNPWRRLTSYAIADMDGRFRLRAIWPGMAQELRISRGGYGERALPVDVLAPGESRDLGDIQLDIADLVITGVVIDENDNPVPGVSLNVQRMRGHFSRSFSAETGLDGRFRIAGLPCEQVSLRANEFQFRSQYLRAGPESCEVVLRAIRHRDQVQFMHEFAPPLRAEQGGLTVTLRGLCRFKTVSADGEVGQYLGLDIDVNGEEARKADVSVWVTDDQGRELTRTGSTPVQVDGRYLVTMELPEAGVTSLARIAVGAVSPPADELIEFADVESLKPADSGDHHVMLFPLEFIDEWLAVDGDEAPAPGDAPYLSARLYAVVARGLSYEVTSASALPDGPPLQVRRIFHYDPNADAIELADDLPQWHEYLIREARTAMSTLKDWGVRMPRDPIVVGCWMQSKGNQGDAALPDALRISLRPVLAPGCAAVAFDDIPISFDLTQAAVDFDDEDDGR